MPLKENWGWSSGFPILHIPYLSPRGLSLFRLKGHQSFLSLFLTLSPLNLVVKENEDLTERSEKEGADSLHVTVSYIIM